MAQGTTDRRRPTADPSAALAAALLFAIQVVVGGLWMGAHAAPAGYDAFGHALCAWPGAGDADKRPAGHVPLPECCASGCSLAGPAPAAESVALKLLAASKVRGAAPLRGNRFVRRIDRASIRARGPPILI